MFDMHCHVLYGIDDGSKTLENSVEMLRTAERVGFQGVVLTPHYMSYTNFISPVSENKKRLKALRNAIKEEGINLMLFLGNELYYEPDLLNMTEGREFTTINKSDYFLVETMRHDSNVEHLQDFLYRLQTKGYRTILAHPERYDFVQDDPNVLIDFMEKGTYMQINMLSLIGFYGSRAQATAQIMLDHNMVQFMASDAHRVKSYEKMEEACDIARSQIGDRKFKEIMTLNPAIVISNKSGINCHPFEYEGSRKAAKRRSRLFGF